MPTAWNGRPSSYRLGTTSNAQLSHATAAMSWSRIQGSASQPRPGSSASMNWSQAPSRWIRPRWPVRISSASPGSTATPCAASVASSSATVMWWSAASASTPRCPATSASTPRVNTRSRSTAMSLAVAPFAPTISHGRPLYMW